MYDVRCKMQDAGCRMQERRYLRYQGNQGLPQVWDPSALGLLEKRYLKGGVLVLVQR